MTSIHPLNIVFCCCLCCVISLTCAMDSSSSMPTQNPTTKTSDTDNAVLQERLAPDPSGKLSKFGKDISAFSLCSIMNHDSLCRKCSDEITRVTASYVDLMGPGDYVIPAYSGVFNGSRSRFDDLSVISLKAMDTINDYYKHARSVWRYANCDNCYEGKSKKFSNDVITFFNTEYQFNDCVEGTKANSTCRDCHKYYSQMNRLYENMMYDYVGNLCLDIRESMATARGKWQSLGCVVAVGFDIIVISVASLVILASILLYVISRKFSYVDQPAVVTQKRLAHQLSVNLTTSETADETTYLLSHTVPQRPSGSTTIVQATLHAYPPTKERIV